MIFRKAGRDIEWAEELGDLSWNYRAARIVQVASGVGMFRRLAEGRVTATDVAGGDLEAGMVEKVLIALAAMGLAGREGEGWALTAKARATLIEESPLYQGHMLAHSAQVWSYWNDFESAVRGERGGWVWSAEGQPQARTHRDFILAMHEMAMAGRAAALAERVDLEGRRTLVDVGGGPGTYAMALCERNPDLAATVLDLPETIEIAREVIGRLGMADRVRTQVGDWNTDEFGRNRDAVLVSNILHGPTSAAEMKLAKAHRALRPGGLLIVQDFLMNAEKTGPLVPAIFNVMVGAFSVTELTDRIAAAGFKNIRVTPMPERVGTTVVTAVK
jgi:ubiquinone/menaquinone biosynthesis C-methylase UbiE